VAGDQAVTRRRFGQLDDGADVYEYVVTKGDIELRAIAYGAIITSLRVPDRNGAVDDVVLGHATLAPYLENTPYLGALIGRCANRIANGRFRLNGAEHRLSVNDGAHHLHGGIRGFDRRLWDAAAIASGDAPGISFSRTSPAGEEGYPGTMRVVVRYLVEPPNVRIEADAVTDAATIVNLTQHTYFNLGGPACEDVRDHDLTIHADGFSAVDDGLIPTGEIVPVGGTPFDFRRSSCVGNRLAASHQQLAIANGFDHNFVLSKPLSAASAAAAVLVHRSGGRRLTVATDQPGLQFYSGNFLDGRGHAGQRRLKQHAGLCLETQHYPDAPNHPGFPPVTLLPAQRYRTTTIWQFDSE
jgi:aldose 1-epimerase